MAATGVAAATALAASGDDVAAPPAPPADPAAVLTPSPSAPLPGDPVTAIIEAPAPAPEPLEVAGPVAAAEPVPVLPPAAPYLAYVLPPQDPNAAPTLYPAPAYMGQPMVMPGQPMMMPGMMPAGMAMMPAAPAEPVERESFFRRLWHLDVMAPIIAVLIVLAILAAWVL